MVESDNERKHDRGGPLETLQETLTPIRVTLAGVVVTAVAAVLPWVQAESPDTVRVVSGIDVDGFLTLLLAIGVTGLIFVRDWEFPDRIGSLLSGVLVISLTVSFLFNPVFSTTVTEEFVAGVTVAPKIGAYLTLGGGGLIVVGSLWALFEHWEAPGDG